MKHKIKRISKKVWKVLDVLSYLILWLFACFFLFQTVDGYFEGDYVKAVVSAIISIPFILIASFNIFLTTFNSRMGLITGSIVYWLTKERDY